MSTVWRLPFGKFKNELITRVPPSYLNWMIVEGHPNSDKAAEELQRRGTPCNYQLDITAHALDRASLRLMHLWVATANENEGLYTWLGRRAGCALDLMSDENKRGNKKVEHDGIIFVLEFSTLIPVLTSVWTAGSKDEL